MARWLRKLAAVLCHRRLDDELDEELRFHLDAQIEEHVAAGMSPEDARRIALRDFGGVEQTKDAHRDARGMPWLESLWQDLRYAARTMASNRTFTIMAVLSLALGIGANTAIYSFMEAILLRSLPVPEPESLVVVKWQAQGLPKVVKGFSTSDAGLYQDPGGALVASIFPYPALEVFQSSGDVLANAFCYVDAERLNVTIRGQTEAVQGQHVSGDFFRGLGVAPAV